MQALISEANGRGGLDNITAIIVQVIETDPADGRSEPHAGDRAGWLTRRSASVAELYLGNILYAIELAAMSLTEQGKADDGGVLPRRSRASSPRRTGGRSGTADVRASVSCA